VVQTLHASLSSYISNQQWSIPTELLHSYPDLRKLAVQVTLPILNKVDSLDMLIWNYFICQQVIYLSNKHMNSKSIIFQKFLEPRRYGPKISLLLNLL